MAVAVITGASRGIGKAVAGRLAADGWSIGCGASTLENAQPVAAQLADEHGVATMPLAMPVQNRSAIDAALDAVEESLGPIALMVNNAGVAAVTPFLDVEPNDFVSIVDVNLVGVFHGSQAAARRMVASGTAGSIIQMGSIAGINSFPSRVGYCGTKAAVHQMARVMALDLAEHNIRVNSVAPGYIRTDMVQDLIDGNLLQEAPLKKRIPTNELGTVDDIANAVAFLASDQAAYITGHTLAVDGGWLASGHI